MTSLSLSFLFCLIWSNLSYLISADCDIDTLLRDQGIEVYVPTDDGYDDAKEQYGETAIPFADKIAPDIIAYAANASDAALIVDFVNHCEDIDEITIRAGGHSYSGLSSCVGKCLQLDVTKIKTLEVLNPDYGVGNTNNENINNDEVLNTLTNRALIKVGAGWGYGEIYPILYNMGISFIGGSCKDVYVGGNYQSSGHSAWTTGLGAGIDWIKSYEMVLANGSIVTVDASDPNATVHVKALDWALKGGSPGAFGVVINYNIEVMYDSNFPNAFVSFTYYAYSKATFEAVLHLFNELVQDPDYADNQDWGIALVLQGSIYDAAPQPAKDYAVSIGEENVCGIGLHYLGMDTNTSYYDHPIYHKYIAGMARNASYNPLFTVAIPIDVPVTPSQRNVIFSEGWNYWDTGYGSALGSTHFSNDYWSDFAEGVDELMNFGYYPLSAIFVDWGSTFYNNDPDNMYTSHAWRDTKIFVDLWNRVSPLNNATDDMDEYNAMKENAQRLLDTLFGNLADSYLPDVDKTKKWLMYTWGPTNIDDVWQDYYDNEEMYNQLRRIKCAVDPNNVFNTPFTVNPLCDDGGDSGDSGDSGDMQSTEEPSSSNKLFNININIIFGLSCLFGILNW